MRKNVPNDGLRYIILEADNIDSLEHEVNEWLSSEETENPECWSIHGPMIIERYKDVVNYYQVLVFVPELKNVKTIKEETENILNSIKNSKGIVDKFFHIFKNEKIQWQGRVLSSLPMDNFLVEFYSWIDGRPTKEEIIHFSKMYEWAFYSTNHQMIDAYKLKCKNDHNK